MDANLILTGQSNADLIYQNGLLPQLIAEVKSLLGWGASDNLQLLGGPGQTTWAGTALSPAAITGNPAWLAYANGVNAAGGFVDGPLETTMHQYLAGLPASVQAAPTVVVIAHNESDSTIPGLTVDDAETAFTAQITDIAAALGQPVASLLVNFVFIPYDFAGNQGTNPGDPTAFQILGVDQSAQNIQIAEQAIASNPNFSAHIGARIPDSNMTGTDPYYGGLHLSGLDMTNLSRLAISIATELLAYARPGSPIAAMAASNGIDWSGPQVTSVTTVAGQPNQLDLHFALVPGTGLQALSAAAAAGAGWTVRAGGISIAATAASLSGPDTLRLTFATPLPNDGAAALFYGWGDGRVDPASYTSGHDAAVYDTTGLPVWADATGVPIGQGNGAAWIEGTPGQEIISLTDRDTTIAAGAAGGVLFGPPTAGLTFIGGTGSLAVVPGQGQTMVFGGPAPLAVFAGTGSTTVVEDPAVAAWVAVGSGNLAVFDGGGGTIFDLTAGQAGGNVYVNGFRSGVDQIDLHGYTRRSVHHAFARAHVTAGGTSLTLHDGTTLTFVDGMPRHDDVIRQ